MFLETLKQLMESKDLWVELKPDRPSYMVLKGTYGERLHRSFRMSRQGVRWRFQRLLNEIYVSSFETIIFVERIFGTQLRGHAIRISKERHVLHQEACRGGFVSAETLQRRMSTRDHSDTSPTDSERE